MASSQYTGVRFRYSKTSHRPISPSGGQCSRPVAKQQEAAIAVSVWAGYLSDLSRACAPITDAFLIRSSSPAHTTLYGYHMPSHLFILHLRSFSRPPSDQRHGRLAHGQIHDALDGYLYPFAMLYRVIPAYCASALPLSNPSRPLIR